MKFEYIIISLFVLICSNSHSQITFQKTYGRSSNNDFGYAVRQTLDQGYIFTGWCGDGFTYLIKTDGFGDTLWSKSFPGSPIFNSNVIQTSDGNFVFAANVDTLNIGSKNMSLIKVDASGNTIWAITYDAGLDNGVFDFKQTLDNGYIFTGFTEDINGRDLLLIKTDSVGSIEFTKIFGGINQGPGIYVSLTNDGGFIISSVITIIGSGPLISGIQIIKTNSVGDTTWTKTIHESFDDVAYSITQTIDGGYILSGQTFSFGTSKAFLIKLDYQGNISWSKTYGDNITARNSIQNSIGGYVILAAGDVGNGNYDILLINTDSVGNVLWCKAYGGTNTELNSSFDQTSDGGYIINGKTESFGVGFDDIYLIKTDSNGNSNCNESTIIPVVNVVNYSSMNIPPTVLNGSVTINSIQLGSESCSVTSLCQISYLPEFNSSYQSTISPNPFTHTSTLTINGNLKKAEFNIFDVQGKIVIKLKNLSGQQFIINRDNLKSGIYFYHLIEDDEILSRGKMIID